MFQFVTFSPLFVSLYYHLGSAPEEVPCLAALASHCPWHCICIKLAFRPVTHIGTQQALFY